MPKRSFLILAILICCFCLQASVLNALEIDEIQTIERLFQHMKEGKTSSILSIILTDSKLSKKKPFFKKNSYSLFLKKTYGNANLVIGNIESIGTDKSSIDVEIDFNDGGHPLKTRLILMKDEGIWKISEEIFDSTN
jgi:hypothetical protein